MIGNFFDNFCILLDFFFSSNFCFIGFWNVQSVRRALSFRFSRFSLYCFLLFGDLLFDLIRALKLFSVCYCVSISVSNSSFRIFKLCVLPSIDFNLKFSHFRAVIHFVKFSFDFQLVLLDLFTFDFDFDMLGKIGMWWMRHFVEAFAENGFYLSSKNTKLQKIKQKHNCSLCKIGFQQIC